MIIRPNIILLGVLNQKIPDMYVSQISPIKVEDRATNNNVTFNNIVLIKARSAMSLSENTAQNNISFNNIHFTYIPPIENKIVKVSDNTAENTISFNNIYLTKIRQVLNKLDPEITVTSNVMFNDISLVRKGTFVKEIDDFKVTHNVTFNTIYLNKIN